MVKDIRKFGYIHSPEILAGAGIAGFISSIVLCIKATPKAHEKLEEKKEELETDILTPVEVVKTVWKDYLPAAILVVASGGCIICSVTTSKKRYASLAAAYEIVRTNAEAYKDKVIETIGEKKNREIEDKVNEDKVKKDPPTNENIIMGSGVLFYEPLTGQYFRMPINDFLYKANVASNDELNSHDGSYGVYDWLLALDLLDRIPESVADKYMGMGWSVLEQQKAVIISYTVDDEDRYNGEQIYIVDYSLDPIDEYYILERS